MKNVINENGDIYLKSKDGIPTRVASVKYGTTFNLLRGNPKQITKVTIYSMKLQDEFFFLGNGNPVFHHLQTRALNPNLTDLYLRYFAEEEFSPESFLKYVFKRYFKVLGYWHPELISVENKAANAQ